MPCKKRPSGVQKRKAKKAELKLIKTLAGSMLQYVQRLDDGLGSSKDTARQSPIDGADSSGASSKDAARPSPIDGADSSGASMRSAEEQGPETAGFEAEEQGVEMEECEAKESAGRDSGHDSVNEMNDVEDEALEILRDVSFWEIPVRDHFRVEIIKRGSASFQNKDGPFSVVKDAQGNMRQLSTEWFYKKMPNGEEILRSWMVYSLTSKNLYCFCCRLFAVSATNMTSEFVTGFQMWGKLSSRVHDHEISKEHLCCLEKWKTLAAALRLHKTIDAALKGKKGKF